jgi:5'-deoxynucleotidase YfbR-like HD superfamily hydrolase
MNAYFETAYALSNLKRFPTHHVNKQQNIAMHTCNCMFIAMYIIEADKVECDRGVLLQKILFHDFVEGRTGDIAAPIKHYTKELYTKIKDLESEMLTSIFKDLPVNFKQIAVEAKDGKEGEIVALVDIIERLIYLCMEKRSGNQVTNDVYVDTSNKLKTKAFRELLKKYPTASEIIFHYLSKVQA